jgi:hypothetical protein
LKSVTKCVRNCLKIHLEIIKIFIHIYFYQLVNHEKISLSSLKSITERACARTDDDFIYPPAVMAQTDHAGKKKRPGGRKKSKYCWEKHTPQGKTPTLLFHHLRLIFPIVG